MDITWVLRSAGYLIIAIAWVWLLIRAFHESLGWGFGCLLIPFISIIFLFARWDAAKKPFLYMVLGVALIFGAGSLAPGSEAVLD